MLEEERARRRECQKRKVLEKERARSGRVKDDEEKTKDRRSSLGKLFHKTGAR